MGTVKIYVGKKENSNKLRLRDSENNNPGNDKITTGVNPGDTVEWIIDTEHPGISSILKVERKKESDSHHLLTAEPDNPNGVWQGTVKKPSVGKDKIEKYRIKYTVEDSSDSHWDDPKLKMNT
ncbi:hypothetical protein [Christiangramia sediminis]|uniref:Uncharacterized protein n=1 Tax=Christiangramia sediminis TaxID=2881336 RepID=A0A9X1LGY4_9FLAO|nr:hypothetical protein [Christiangramia sediminis]MCB7480149.1 hypothetical protein [Christiangramia sediminis]